MAAIPGGTDFWATLGVGQEQVEEAAEQRPVKGTEDRRVAGPTDGEAATAPRAGEKPLQGKAADKPGAKHSGGTKQNRTPRAPQKGTTPQADWASMFSDGLRASEDWPGPPLTQHLQEPPVPQRPVDTADLHETKPQDAKPKGVEPQGTEPQDAKPKDVEPRDAKPKGTEPQDTQPKDAEPRDAKPKDAKPKGTEPQRTEPKPLAVPDGARDLAAPPADPAWTAAERIAASIEARLSETWLEVLTRHTDGDRVLAGRVYQVLLGRHLLGELWLDERVNEVHVRGTRVTVCAADGVYEVPGFPDRASARKAIAAIKAAQEEMDAIVTQVGDSYVVNRSHDTGPGAESLVASGVITRELLQQIRDALQRLEAVTVTGPAARTVVRALASLIPSGSRVFVGPLMVLPSGCVAAKGPLDADFVTGVRPGAVAEDMAAAGQVGALIANPETRFQAAVRLVVTGRSLAPGKVSLH